jgi:dienelactone hydrolase
MQMSFLIRHHLLGLAFLACLAAAAPAWAQTPPDLASRIELRTFSSLTLADSQFLQGDAKATPVTLAGELRFPATPVAGAKLPVVIIVHGSGGNNSGHENWARVFNQMGVATFMLDSLSGRGLTQVNTDQDRLGRFNMTLDVFRAQEMLAAHPRIDAERISLIGGSRGGTAVLYSAMRRFQKMWSPNFKVVATFPLYTSCYDHIHEDTDVVGRIHGFSGEADNYVDFRVCAAYFKRMKDAGRDVELDTLPNVHHSYDNVLSKVEPTPSVGAQSQFKCVTREEKGVLVNQQTKQPFSYRDACITMNPNLGYSPDATAKTIAAVTGELRELFKLP